MKISTLHRSTFFLFTFFLLSSTLCVATTYTWTGNTNTSWTTTTNWSPNGNPTTTDYIIIQTGTNNLVLTGNKTINRFRINSGVMDLNGYTLTVTNQVLMYGGVVEAGKILQNGTNTAYITSTEVNCKLDLTATTVTARYSNFADSVKVKQTTTSGTIYWHGNRFYKHLHVENTSNGNMNIGNNPADTCFDGLTMTGRRIRFGYKHAGNLVVGDVVINSTGASGTQIGIVTGNTNGGAHVDGDIYVNQTGTAQIFFGLAGQMTQSAGHFILDGTTGYQTGELKIQNFTQLGSGGGIALTYGASSQTMMIEPDAELGSLNLDLDDVSIDGAVIKGSANVVANHLSVTDNDFLSASSFTKTGSVNDLDNGGNRFYGPLSVTLDGSADMHFAFTAPDTAFSTLQLRTMNNSLVLGEYDHFVAMGSVYCDEQAGNIILGGSYGGDFTIAGAGLQTLALEQGIPMLCSKITVNKPSGHCRLTGTMEVTGSLTLTQGVIVAVDSGLVLIQDGVSVSGASDASHVEGPVEKEGNDAFTFPVGRNGIYQPLTITAPSSTAHTFRAEYLDEDSDPDYTHSSRDGSIAYLDRTQYWMFTRTAGTGGVYVTLGWRDVACGIASISDPDICAWSGTQWKNLGNDLEAGTVVTGTARTGKTSFYYGAYAWGNFSGISAHAGPDRVIEVGDTVQIGIMEQPDWDYSWIPSASVEEPDSAITRAYPTSKTEYVLEVTGENSCTAKDTAIVFITEMPEDTARSSLDFVVNNGQIIDTDGAPRPDVGIYSHQASPMVYCGDNRVSFVHAKIDTLAATPDTLARVDINFHETFRNAEPLGMGLNPHHYNYYYAHCPDGVTLTPTYNRVVYPLLYENTDLHIKGNNNWMKFEFVMHPGADPEDILMTFDGADNVQVIQQLGLLVVTSSIGTYVFPKPKALKIDTVSGAVELGWQPDWDLSVTGDTVRFTNIGAYNPAEVLIFTLGEEPFVSVAAGDDNLEWSTYFGHSGSDYAYNTTIGNSNTIVVVGATQSTMFPVTAGSVQDELAGGVDAFISYFTESGIQGWSTFYGGNETAVGLQSSTDIAKDVATSSSGWIYVVGETQSYDFPLVPSLNPNAFFKPNIGNWNYPDAFILRLRPGNGVVLWSTFFGDDDVYDAANGIAIDGSDNVFMVGDGTNVSNFPLLNPGGNAFYKDDEASTFIARFNSDDELTWSTLFGTEGTDVITDVCTDNNDNLIVVGYSGGEYPSQFDFANDGSGYQDNTYNGGQWDAFVAKFTSDAELYWSTYLGGDDTDIGQSVITDLDGNIYLCGSTLSTSGTLPLQDAGGFYDDVSEGSEAFIAKFDGTGSKLWFTLYGGDRNDRAMAIDVSLNGHVYVVGESFSSDLFTTELTDAYYQSNIGNPVSDNNSDAFILCVDGSLEPVWITYFGGNATTAAQRWDIPRGIRLSNDDSFFAMVGQTHSNGTFPLRDLGNGAYWQPDMVGINTEGFISKFEISTLLSSQTSEAVSEGRKFVVFPNPNTGEFQLLMPSMPGESVSIEIFNSLGQTIYREERKDVLSNSVLSFNVNPHVAAGIFWVKVSSRDFMQVESIVIHEKP